MQLGSYVKMSENIKTLLNYNRDDGTRPYKFGRPRTKQEQFFYLQDEGGPRDFVPITVRNAREKDLCLDKNSFELIHHETSLDTEEFYKSSAITSVYYKEIAQCIKDATGKISLH